MIELFQEEEFRYIEGGVKVKDGKHGFRRNIMMEIDDLANFRKRYNNKGIYVTAYRYNNKVQADAELYGHLYVDFDSDSDEVGYEQVREDAMRALAFFSAIFSVSEEDVRIYFSGKKGIHLIIPAPILGVNPDKELNDIFKLIALDVHKISVHKTVDTRIYDRVRLFRVPNSVHPDTGLHKVSMTPDQLRNFSYDGVQNWAKKARPPQYKKDIRYNTKAHRVFKEYMVQWEKEKAEKNFNKKKGKGKLNFCPPCVRHMLRNETPDGTRNNTTAALCSYFKQRGYSEEEAYNRLSKWNGDYCSPSLPDWEITRTIKSIYSAEYTYGCTSLAEISGACNPEKCKLAKKK